MNSERRSRVPGHVWERHKEEIKRMYVDENQTLFSVKQHMEESRQFPRYPDLSMWKKRIGKWGFDRKNNKMAAVATVVAHYQQCLDEGKRFSYTPPNHKSLNTAEVQGYLSRKKMTINDAKIVPKASLTMATAASEMNTDQVRGLNIEAGECTQAVVQTSLPTSDYLASHSQTCLLRARSALSFGQTLVRPADLIVPECHQAHETFLVAMQNCLLSSWSARLWNVDEEGFFNLASPEKLGFNWFEFGHLLRQACLHLERSEVHRGRKLLFNAASCLRVGLTICLPSVIYDVLFFIASLFVDGKPKYAKHIIACCGNLLGGVCSDVRLLFSSLGAIESVSLPSVMSQGWELFSSCMENMDERLYSRSVSGRIRRLQDDLLLDGKNKASKMTSLLVDVQNHRPRSVVGELDCMENVAWSTWKSGELERAIQVASDALQLIKPLQDSQNEQWKWQTARLMKIRSFARWDAGDADGAVHDMQCAIHWKSQHGLASSADDISKLAAWHATLQDEQAAQTNQERHNQMVDSFVNLKLDDSRPEPVPHVREGSNQPNTWRHSKRGKVSGQAAAESYQTAWRECVEPAMQEQVLLESDEMSNEEGML